MDYVSPVWTLFVEGNSISTGFVLGAAKLATERSLRAENHNLSDTGLSSPWLRSKPGVSSNFTRDVLDGGTWGASPEASMAERAARLVNFAWLIFLLLHLLPPSWRQQFFFLRKFKSLLT